MQHLWAAGADSDTHGHAFIISRPPCPRCGAPTVAFSVPREAPRLPEAPVATFERWRALFVCATTSVHREPPHGKRNTRLPRLIARHGQVAASRGLDLQPCSRWDRNEPSARLGATSLPVTRRP